jgi:uncharacterized protein (DUF58 family)
LDLTNIQQFPHLELIAKQVVEGFITGLHKSPFHGFSVEFAEHRLYNTGESTRYIDWKLYGKTDKLFVKRFEEETNLRCQLVIDNSSSMYFPVKTNSTLSKIYSSVNSTKTPEVTKISFSVYCAAALIELLKRQRDATGLTVFSDNIEFNVAPKSNSVHNKLMYHQLEKLLVAYNANIHKKTSAVAALHQIAELIHKRSLVIIFSDMMDSSNHSEELFSALQHLKHNKHEVILFHVTDKQKEIDFEFENRPYRFIDMETQDEVKVYPNQIKENYKASIAKYNKELMLKCHQYKIDFVEADINQSFDQILMPYLLKRKRMM